MVCSYAGSKTIKQCLDSLVGQKTDHTYEILIIDDGSTDGTSEVVKFWLENYNGAIKVRHICFENGGLSMARNRGIDNSVYELVAFIDEDAIAHEGWVDGIMKEFNANPKVNVVGGEVFLRNAKNPVATWIYDAFVLPYMADEKSVIGTNMSFRKSLLIDLGGFVTDFTYRGDETVLFKKAPDQLVIKRSKDVIVFHDQPESFRHWLKNRYENGFYGVGADLYVSKMPLPMVILKFVFIFVASFLIGYLYGFFVGMVALLFIFLMDLVRTVLNESHLPKSSKRYKKALWKLIGEYYYLRGFISGFQKFAFYKWSDPYRFE